MWLFGAEWGFVDKESWFCLLSMWIRWAWIGGRRRGFEIALGFFTMLKEMSLGDWAEAVCWWCWISCNFVDV